MIAFESSVILLLLIIVANGAPIISRELMGGLMSQPVDFGYRLTDNNPLFGKSKTWRGLVAGVLATSVAALLFGYPALTGALVAVYALLGDLFSSFIKRRLGMTPHSMALFLDQVPESLLPAVMMMEEFDLDSRSIIILVCAFIVAELALSAIFYRLGVRKKPY